LRADRARDRIDRLEQRRALPLDDPDRLFRFADASQMIGGLNGFG
jgi:hypothetical protein